MEIKRYDIFLLDGFILAAIILSFTGATNLWLRLLFGLPLVFFLPGYAFVEAFFPRKWTDSLARWVIILGMSIILTIMAGFVLNITRWGLQYPSWALLLGSFTILLAQFALFNRYYHPVPEPQFVVPAPKRKFSTIAAVLFYSSVLIALWALAFSNISTISLYSPPSEFWMLPSTNPTQANNSQQVTLDIGIKSTANNLIRYRVVILAGGQTIKEWQDIVLSPDQTWEGRLVLFGVKNQSGPIQAFLYRSDLPNQVYRTATWWPSQVK